MPLPALPPRTALALSALTAFAAGCATSPPPPDPASAASASAPGSASGAGSAPGSGSASGAAPGSGSASGAASGSGSAPGSASASAPTSASAAAGIAAASEAGAADVLQAPAADKPAQGGEAKIVADNKVEPTEGPELQERAKGLFEAIVKDEPALGDPFWFPKEPFIPLKDVKGPDKYWETLHKTYVSDIHALHKKRKSWDKATFVRFERGSLPKWVKPGEEANKIGYHRSFHGKLRYVIDGQNESIDVHTVITWQGRWYITHLRKFKK